jgi:hypothetical protein
MLLSAITLLVSALSQRRHRHSSGTGGGRRRAQPFRPQVEQLDDRLVPSTVGLSSAISINHTIYIGGIPYHWTERDWYTIDLSSPAHQAVEFQGTTRHNLGGPGAIGEVSASVDPQTGFGGVFALDDYGTIWWFNSAGNWSALPGSYRAMCATGDGHVYAATSVGSDVLYLSANGSATDLGAPAAGIDFVSPYSLAASTGLFGGNEVFAIGQDGAIYVNSTNAHGQWGLVDNSQFFWSLSAARNNTLFATTASGKLYEETEQIRLQSLGRYGPVWVIYWASQNISGSQVWEQISADTDASGAAEVYAIAQTGNAYLYDQGSWALKDSYVWDISGADGGYFYDVNQYYGGGNLLAYQYNPNTSTHWTYLGLNLS